ncbi:hypothetical protein Y1Q_0001927 [Alligator mississippiensis]|uniref:Uncharacterized protein n=1 Tax=Alligator mississippiensis TaxID=8496 RepID=A0A151PGP5_ALLMI|nr:hypothetical protein Y1Q_0001927 [Alligator mississippiensis]
MAVKPAGKRGKEGKGGGQAQIAGSRRINYAHKGHGYQLADPFGILQAEKHNVHVLSCKVQCFSWLLATEPHAMGEAAILAA